MDHLPCNCLLCQDPPDEAAWDERDRSIADKIRRYGWNVMGVGGDERTPGWAYSIGLWHTMRSPEVCVFGLPNKIGMDIVNIVGDQIREGQALQSDERRGDVLTSYDVAVRPVHPGWYRNFFGAAVDFHEPPLPIVQVFWPDRQGRFPWEQDAEDSCRASQPLLWMSPAEHPEGVWTEVDPYRDWPFGASLPYTSVRATPAVVAGTTKVAAVVRDHDGGWQFLDRTDDREATAVTKLRHVVNTHPDVVPVADLGAGQRAERTAEGSWIRSPLSA